MASKFGQGPLNTGSAMKTAATGLSAAGANAANPGRAGSKGVRGTGKMTPQRSTNARSGNVVRRNAGRRQR